MDRQKINLLKDPEIIFYTTAAIASLFISIFFLLEVLKGNNGSILGLLFFIIITISCFYQSYININDQLLGPQIIEGELMHSWKSQGIFSMGRSTYIKINDKIFLISNTLFKKIPIDSNLSITYWPYSKTIISIKLLEETKKEEKN
ncbi:MAG: hypothetical protein QMB22_01565 [Dehalococcoidia bacterium]|jgi:hypothetical protein|nr:MAG: hypothetical protein DK305_000454 [Chloroflexota bacterium]|tara:strand:+ start:1156 stop:1593 length:438 start_codon:yes stop_codon:yes gene_type:complete